MPFTFLRSSGLVNRPCFRAPIPLLPNAGPILGRVLAVEEVFTLIRPFVEPWATEGLLLA